MAKINRYNGNLPAFGSGALGTERTVFGDVTQSDALDDNINLDFIRGWGIVGVNENPTKQDFNAVAYTATQLLAYLHQMGVAEWNVSQEYPAGGLCQISGQLYISQIDSNIGNDPVDDDGTNWLVHGLTQISDLATLRGFTGSVWRHIYLNGRVTDSDGGQGLFRWDANDLSIEVAADEVTLGEGDGGIYVAPASDKTGTSGAWVRVRENLTFSATPQWYGGTDDAAIQIMFNAVGTGAVYLFQPDVTHDIGATVTIPDPENITVIAVGARFRVSADILAFDCNGRADPSYQDNESVQNFHWVGGRFGCTVATPTKAAAFRMLGFRHASLQPEDFGLTYGGFYTDIICGGKDTVYIGRYKTYDAERASILFPPWSVVGGPLKITIEKVHGSLAVNDAKLIESYIPLTDVSITDYSCNLGSGATHDGVIDVNRYVLCGVPSVTGTFSVGETVTGGTSGATATVVEQYTHDFSFQISQNIIWIVLENRSGSFATGETITGGTSGASAVIGSATAPGGEAAYLVQNSSWQNFHLGGIGHWEAGAGAAGAVCIRLRDREGTGEKPTAFSLDVGSLGVNGGGAIGVLLERIGNVGIVGRFAQTSGNGVPIQFDALCTDIKIDRRSFFSTAAIDLNGMSRDELDLSDFDAVFPRQSDITGFQGDLFSTATDTPVDMSAVFSAFKTAGGLAPKAYGVNLNAKDSGSAGATTARVRLHHPDDTDTGAFVTLQVGGVPNDRFVGGYFVVGADTNGDFEYDLIASGVDTMAIEMRVVKMFF